MKKEEALLSFIFNNISGFIVLGIAIWAIKKFKTDIDILIYSAHAQENRIEQNHLEYSNILLDQIEENRKNLEEKRDEIAKKYQKKKKSIKEDRERKIHNLQSIYKTNLYLFRQSIKQEISQHFVSQMSIVIQKNYRQAINFIADLCRDEKDTNVQ